MGGGRSNKERQRLQPFASVARAPLFEVRGVRFTHSPYWYRSVTRASVILFNRCYFNILFFDLKHNFRDTDVVCLHSSISVGLNRSPFTADLVHKQLTVLT